MDIYLATTNSHKVHELLALFGKAGLDVSVKSAEDAGGMPEVDECENTFEGNARLKARALQSRVPFEAWILAEDSGFCVEALGGAPGILSARYSAKNATDEENYTKVLEQLQGIPEDERMARFVCCIILKHSSVGEMMFQGSVAGTVSQSPAGAEGFGYDPIFIPNGFTETFAQLGTARKSQISHRALAMQQLLEWMMTRDFS